LPTVTPGLPVEQTPVKAQDAHAEVQCLLSQSTGAENSRTKYVCDVIYVKRETTQLKPEQIIAKHSFPGMHSWRPLSARAI